MSTRPTNEAELLDVWEIAREVCTAKQLEILELRERRGMSLQAIALSQRLSVSTVRGHLRAATHNLTVELERRRPTGITSTPRG